MEGVQFEGEGYRVWYQMAWVTANSTAHQLCDLGQVTGLLCASFPSPGKYITYHGKQNNSPKDVHFLSP